MFRKVILMASLFSLFGCTDMRTYRYYDFHAVEMLRDQGKKIEVILMGDYRDSETENSVTIRGNPYYLLIRFESLTKMEGELILDGITLFDMKEQKNIPLVFTTERRFMKFSDSADKNHQYYHVGIAALNLTLEHVEHRVTGVITIKNKDVVIFKQKIDVILKPNYHEDRQSDTVSRILSG